MKTPRDWQRREMGFRNRAETVPVPIVADGALRIPGVMGGKMIPMVVLDTSQRPDIEKYIQIHQELGSGDIISHWGKARFGKSIALLLTVVRPVELNILLKFDAVRNTHLINIIAKSEALYLQPGRPGDRVRNFVDAPKLLFSVPEQGFRQIWEREHRANVIKRLRRGGLSKKEAHGAAEQHIKTMSLLEDSVASTLGPATSR